MCDQSKTNLAPYHDLAKKFAGASLAANRHENDRYPFGGSYDAAVGEAHKLGFFSIMLPAPCGGSGLELDVLCAILDEISQVDASMAGIIFTNAFAQEMMLEAGCRDKLQKMIAQVSNARDALIAFPSYNNPSETEVAVEARKEGNRFALSGSLEYLVLGPLASWAVVPAKVQGQENFSCFLVKLSDGNIKRSAPVFSLGLHACPACDVEFNAVGAELLGEASKGGYYFEKAADRLYAASAAISAGIMKGSFKEAFDYSRERTQGGRNIVDWSALRMMLAEMAVKVQIADMAVSQACRAVMDGSPAAYLQTRAAAIHVQDLSANLTTDGIQILGGYGYMKDFGQEKRFRDAKQAQSLLGLVPMKKLRFMDYLKEKDGF